MAKTLVATGASSGLGLEAVKQLLAGPQPFRIILGARNPRAEAALAQVPVDGGADAVSVLPLDLADLAGVGVFARRVLDTLGAGPIDYLLLNAGLVADVAAAGPRGSRWCEPAIVNHFAQHYLVHLLRDKLVASRARVVFVSSGVVSNVSDPGLLETHLTAGSGAHHRTVYSETKFIQLLSAHWWRRQLAGQCRVVAVSPGLVPNTGLGRSVDLKLSMDMPDAKTVPQGARSILAALTRDDFPDDPERIFLTSWGEWWPKDVYAKTLDRALQDKWCPTKDELEKAEGISA